MTTPDAPQCKVAIVGAGYMATEHAKAFADVAGVQLVGIHSRTRSRAEKLAAEQRIVQVCDSVEELYAKTKPDLVVVTVGELSMNAASRACFEHPWTVLLEKPAGYNVADAEEIAAVARAKQRRVFVALNRRFYSATRTVLDRLCVDKGSRFIRLQDQEDQVRARQAGQPELVVENWMYANSIHVIDYLRLFGRGRIQRVVPVVAWDAKRPAVVVSKIEFESGDVGLYEAVWNQPGPWSVAVTTPAARYEMRPLEKAFVQPQGERKTQELEGSAWDQEFKPGLRLQAENAVAAALGQASDSISLDDALQTMCLVRDIYGLAR
jgi:predicted dehydrogenase